VEAVARELVRRDIIPDVAGLCGLGQQISDQGTELPLRSGDVLTSVQECREFGAVLAVVGDERIGLEHRLESLARVAGLVVLLVLTALSVYKPQGMTPYGWRKQHEQRAQSQP
jgi:hypothetical protein